MNYMGFEEFNFTKRYRCPSCKTGMIVIDNKIVSCPICESTANNNQE
ncbi:MAG: hypothetical protein ACW986_08825 [Promethearchaeota archaeon]